MAPSAVGRDASPATRTFFVHVMKTGGTSFWWQVYANLGEEHIYPYKAVDPYDAYFSIARLRSLTAERHETTRGYVGHFPWMATELVPHPLVTLSIVRDPVERTISYLRQAATLPGPYTDWPLERIYEDPLQYGSVIQNHQTKIFSMNGSDPCVSYLDTVEIDGRRLEAARENVAKVDVLGTSEAFPEFLEAVERRLGWELRPVSKQRVSQSDEEVPASLRRRIAEDNSYDMAFYDYVQALVASRLAA